MADNSEDIFIWIFSFLIIVLFVFLLFFKVQQVSSNKEFFSEYHSFVLSNVLNSVFLDDYFKVPYSLGKLENVDFEIKKDNEKQFFVLKNNNNNYRNLIFIPENVKFESEGSFSGIFTIVKDGDKLSFKKPFVCEKKTSDIKVFLSQTLIVNKEYFKNSKISSKNVVLLSKEDDVDACTFYYSLKEKYNNKNVLLLRVPDENFFSNKKYVLLLG